MESEAICVNIEVWSICIMIRLLVTVMSRPQKMSYHVEKYTGMCVMIINLDLRKTILLQYAMML